MAWRRIGDKPLSEPMLTRFLYVAYMWHSLTHLTGKNDSLQMTISISFSSMKMCILIQASLNFAPKGPFTIEPQFVQIMACIRTGHYLNQWWPCLLSHICVTRPHWVKPYRAEFRIHKIYLNFLSFLNRWIGTVFKILERLGPFILHVQYLWLLVPRWRKEPDHLQLGHWPNSPEYSDFSTRRAHTWRRGISLDFICSHACWMTSCLQ